MESRCYFSFSAMITSIRISRSRCTYSSGISESVTKISISPNSRIMWQLRFPNLVESATAIICSEMSHIRRLRLASCSLYVVIPTRKSKPSTPRKTLSKRKFFQAGFGLRTRKRHRTLTQHTTGDEDFHAGSGC